MRILRLLCCIHTIETLRIRTITLPIPMSNIELTISLPQLGLDDEELQAEVETFKPPISLLTFIKRYFFT